MHNIISAIILVCKTDADAGEIMIKQWADSPLALDILQEEMRTDPKVRARFLRSLVDMYRTAEPTGSGVKGSAGPKRPLDDGPILNTEREPKPRSHMIRDYLQGAAATPGARASRGSGEIRRALEIGSVNTWKQAIAEALHLFAPTKHNPGIYREGHGPATHYRWGNPKTV